MRISRLAIIVLAVLATLGLLYLMMILINSDYEVEEPEPPTIIANIDMPKPPDGPIPSPPPEKPHTQEKPEAPIIKDRPVHTTSEVPPIVIYEPTSPGPVKPNVIDRNGDFMPIVQVAPSYPRTAIRQELEGYVTLAFTVTANGSTRDIQVVEAMTKAGEATTVFNRAAVAAVEKYKYKPRVIDGTAVEVPGVRTRLVFEMQKL